MELSGPTRFRYVRHVAFSFLENMEHIGKHRTHRKTNKKSLDENCTVKGLFTL